MTLSSITRLAAVSVAGRNQALREVGADEEQKVVAFLKGHLGNVSVIVGFYFKKEPKTL